MTQLRDLIEKMSNRAMPPRECYLTHQPHRLRRDRSVPREPAVRKPPGISMASADVEWILACMHRQRSQDEVQAYRSMVTI